jgi:hypothetical protein
MIYPPDEEQFLKGEKMLTWIAPIALGEQFLS